MVADADYNNHRMVIITTMYVGYCFYHLTRKSFGFIMPVVMEEGLDQSDLGLVISSQTMAYAFSKFLSGLASDHLSARAMFAVGLFLCGICNVVFILFDSVALYALLWFINGLVQGFGWPACAKILRQWFKPSQFGTWWSILATSMNFAGFVGPLVTMEIATSYGWRAGLLIPGVLSLVLAVLSFGLVVDEPSHVGLENILPSTAKKTTESTNKGDSSIWGRRAQGEVPSWLRVLSWPLVLSWLQASKYVISYMVLFMVNGDSPSMLSLLDSAYLWLICVTYFVTFAVKTSCLNWGQLFLIQDKGHEPYVGSLFTSSLELGGIFGSVIAGVVTDKMVKATPLTGYGSPRHPYVISMLATMLLALYGFSDRVEADTLETTIMTIAFLIGFTSYGAQNLFGVLAIENSPSSLSGTSSAIVALAANFGGLVAGYPFGLIAENYNWETVFIILEISVAASLLAFILLRNIKTRIGPEPAQKTA